MTTKRGIAWRVAATVVAGMLAGAACSGSEAQEADQVTFAVGSASVIEGDAGTRTLAFPVTLSRPASEPVSVAFTVIPAAQTSTSAPTSLGFDVTQGTLRFVPHAATGVTPVEKVVNVVVRSDAVTEDDEKFVVTLHDASTGTAIERAVGTGTIIDDDPASGLRVSAGDVSIATGATGGPRTANLAVTLSRAQDVAVDVRYRVVAGTAARGRDYAASSTGVVHFPPHTRTRMIRVRIRAHAPVDEDRSFRVTLLATSLGQLGRADGVVTIIGGPYVGVVNGPRVAMIGDSLTIFAADSIGAATADAYRSWIVGIPGYSIANALPTLRQQIAASPQAVVVNLGTDDALADNPHWRASYDHLVAMLRPVPCVVFVNINAKLTDYFSAVIHRRAVTVGAEINRAIAATAATRRSPIVDWKAAVDAYRPLLKDGLHPSALGTRWLGDNIRRALDQCVVRA